MRYLTDRKKTITIQFVIPADWHDNDTIGHIRKTLDGIKDEGAFISYQEVQEDALKAAEAARSDYLESQYLWDNRKQTPRLHC